MHQISSHNLPAEFRLTRIMEMEIATYFFYGNIVIVEAKEGILLSYKKDFSVLLNALNITDSNPWVYIANRINSYSIQPMDYKYLNKIPTLKAMAVVNYSEAGHLNAGLEAKFCKKPFQVFYNLTEAVIWGNGFL